jgi:hypothetical protein
MLLPKPSSPAAARAMLVHTPRNVTRTAQDHRRILADIRSQLPITEYLNVLHSLALTGTVPEYDPPSHPGEPPKPNGKFSPPDRVLQQKTLTYLVDKAFAPIEKPAAADVEASLATDDPHAPVNLERARDLTVGQLVRALRVSIEAERLPAPAPEP